MKRTLRVSRGHCQDRSRTTINAELAEPQNFYVQSSAVATLAEGSSSATAELPTRPPAPPAPPASNPTCLPPYPTHLAVVLPPRRTRHEHPFRARFDRRGWRPDGDCGWPGGSAPPRPCSARHGRPFEDRDDLRHRRREPAAGGARGRAGARARRQRRRRRDRDQRGHGAGRAVLQRHRRRPLRHLLRGEDRQAARAERRRLGADRPERGTPEIERHGPDAGQRHLHRDGAGRRRGLGRAAREVRQAADVGSDGAGDFLRRQRLPGVGSHRGRVGARARVPRRGADTRRRRSCRTAARRKPARCSRTPISPARSG